MNWLPRKTVLVPVDFSKASLAAIDAALAMVEQPSDVHVIHVIPEIQAADPGVVWQTIDDENRRTHAVNAVREKLSGDPVWQEIQVAVEIGDPGHRVADYAREVQADLIVLSSHGRTGLERILLGSVAERIVRLAPCPVLVLRN